MEMKIMKNQQYHPRILILYSPMDTSSLDIKYMSKEFGNLKCLLVVTCHKMNFTIAIPLKKRDRKVIYEVLMHDFIGIFGPPKFLTVDTHTTFTEELIQYISNVIKFTLKINSLL